MQGDIKRTTCTSKVFETNMSINIRSFGEALSISYSGKTLEKIKMDDPVINSRMFQPGKHFYSKMPTSDLNSPARILANLLTYNITPKAGSRSTLSDKQGACIYDMLGNIRVNCAKVILENIIKVGTNPKEDTHLVHGNYLTILFRAFGVDTDEETNSMDPNVVFDAHALGRMGLHPSGEIRELGSSSQAVVDADRGKKIATEVEEEEDRWAVSEEEEGEEEQEQEEEEEEEEEEATIIRQLQVMLLKKIDSIVISQGIIRKSQQQIQRDMDSLKQVVVRNNTMTEDTLKMILKENKDLKKRGNGSD